MPYGCIFDKTPEKQNDSYTRAVCNHIHRNFFSAVNLNPQSVLFKNFKYKKRITLS